MTLKSLSASLEDYLEAIYQIGHKDGPDSKEPACVHATEIAQSLDVSKSSVSWALNQLADKGLIHYTPYESITLTDQGRARALAVVQRHREIKNFLQQVLLLDEETAEQNACRMEHILEAEVLQKMAQLSQFVKANPQWGQDFKRTPQQAIPDHAVELDSDQPLPKTSKQRDQLMLKRLQQLGQESGLPITEEQLFIAELFMASEKHQTAAEILRHAQKTHPSISLETVEQTLALLCEYKIARAFRFQQQTYYEHLHPESHHDHLFCVKCGAILEFFDPRIEQLQREAAADADFRILHHNLNLYGVCPHCIHLESGRRSLDECVAGEVVRLARLDADRDTIARLSNMGLRPGVSLEVLNEQCSGNHMMILVGTTRFMLDRSIAHQVRISPGADPTNSQTCPGRWRRHRHVLQHNPEHSAPPSNE